MSGSETFAVGHQRSPITPPQPAVQNMRLAFSTARSAVYKPVNTEISDSSSFQPPAAAAAAGGGGGCAIEGSASGAVQPHGINMNAVSVGEAVKRKRGRPRKYAADGSLAVAQPPPPQQQQQQNGGGENGDFGNGGLVSPPSAPANGGGSAAASQASALVTTKKARGRPPGSTNKKKKQHVLPMGSVPFGSGFQPYVITVNAGEDVSARIMAFSMRGPKPIIVLSAIGAISSVTIRQSSTSGGTVTYEGIFEILSVSGSFMPLENGGQWGRTGGLQVALAGSEGRVIGGSVAGVLIAAAPIQLVVASFEAGWDNPQKLCNYIEPATRLIPAGGSTGPSSPPSRGTPSESSGGPGSPVHPNSGAYNNNGVSSMPWK